jgi:hypothetical protein
MAQYTFTVDISDAEGPIDQTAQHVATMIDSVAGAMVIDYAEDDVPPEDEEE